jgi:hypothetical protein
MHIGLPADSPLRGRMLTFTAYARSTDEAKPNATFRVRNYAADKYFGDTPGGPLDIDGATWRKTVMTARVPAGDAVENLNPVFEGWTETPVTFWITGLALAAGEGGKARLHYWSPEDLELSDRAPAVDLERVPLVARSPVATGGPYPLTFGVPLPIDKVWRTRDMRVTDTAGNEINAQIQASATWQKAGSLRWVLVDVQPDLVKGDTPLFLEYGTGVQPDAGVQPISVASDEESITVDTGPLKMRFSKTAGNLIDAAWLNGNPVLESNEKSGAYFIDNDGVEYLAGADADTYEVVVETHGAWRTVVRAEGWYANAKGNKACLFVHRVWLYRDQPFVKIATTWINTEDTRQFWFKDIGVRFPVAGTGAQTVVFGTDGRDDSAKSEPLAAPAQLTQTAIRTFEIRSNGRVVHTGKRAGGWVHVAAPARSVFLGVEDMHLQHPTAIDVSADGALVYHTFSDRAGFDMDFRHENVRRAVGEDTWQAWEKGRGGYEPLMDRPSNGQGFARTHEMALRFGPSSLPADKAAAIAVDPPYAFSAPDWACATRAFGTCPPIDEKHFPEHEALIADSMDTYLLMARQQNPYIGFWDYGRGTQYYNEKGEADDGEVEWTGRGYRRNYDLGYGTPLSIWQFYLRSGEGRYLQYLKAMGEQEMDCRIFHWATQTAKHKRGMHQVASTTWAWDGRAVAFGDTLWLKSMMLNYYVTGNMRAIDVYGMVMDETLKHFEAGRPSRYWTATVQLGNFACWYRHTWDPRVRKQLDRHVNWWAERLRPDGHPKNRQIWTDYGITEVMEIPDPDPEWIDCAARMARSCIAKTRDNTAWHLMPYVQEWHHRRTGDAWYGCNGRDFVDNPPGFEMSGSGYLGNLPILRVRLAWMALATAPGIDKIVPYSTASYTRPHRTPFFLKHDKDRPLEMFLHTACGETSVTDPRGRLVAPPKLSPEVAEGLFKLTLDEDDPEGIYRIVTEQFELMPPRIRRTAVIEPVNPHLVKLKFKYTAPPKLVQDIRNGGLTASPTAWFFVPEETEEFSVRVTRYVPQVIYLTHPDGTVSNHEEYKITVKPTAEERGKAWGVAVKQCYENLSAGPGFEDKPFFLKLYGVPPFVAQQPEMLFVPEPDGRSPADPEWDSASRFPGGRFGKAVSVIGQKGHVVLPLGPVLDRPGARKYLDIGKGTIEFFIRMPRSLVAGGYVLPVIHVPGEPRAGLDLYMHRFGYGTVTKDAKWQYRFAYAHATAEAYEWHHVVYMWNLNDDGKIMHRFFLNGHPDPVADPGGSMERRNNWPAATEPFHPGEFLYLGGNWTSDDLPIHIDELRISDIPRYPYHQGYPIRPGGSKAFDPPAKPFAVDEHTLALFHFDGAVEGISGNGEPVRAVYRGSLGEE